MILDQTALDLLRTFHGNCREVRAIRASLDASGLRYCPCCESVLSKDAFAAFTRTNGLQGHCRTCSDNDRRRPTYERVNSDSALDDATFVRRPVRVDQRALRRLA